MDKYHKYNTLLSPVELPLVNDRLLVAGPCSAESRDCVMECAAAIEASGSAAVFRAGVWKPRTAPGSFEGVGDEALPWLAEVKERFGMPVAVEVATPGHVEAAAAAGIDIFWIGARTSANPFAVQALADSISAVCPDKPVFVKNPVNPDLELWIGAIARLLNAGVPRVGAIHRGFSVYESSPYRNAPIWQIPMELHRRMPALPMLHDPSHTGGRREHIAPLAQQALDMGFSGLMIECHPAPQQALSDGGQQLTPYALASLIQGLKFRTSAKPDAELDMLRSRIDELDAELLSVLSQRMQVSRQIGEYKRGADMPVVQQDRYNRLLTALLRRGCELGLDETFLTRLLEAIHAESVRCQLSLLNRGAFSKH